MSGVTDRHDAQGDPPGATRAAAALGRLVGRGLLSARECAAPLIAAALAAAPWRDPAGLRARLAHALADAAWTHTEQADRAARCVRAAVRLVLQAGGGSAAVRAAAYAASRGVLTGAEADAVAAAQTASWLARGRPHGR